MPTDLWYAAACSLEGMKPRRFCVRPVAASPAGTLAVRMFSREAAAGPLPGSGAARSFIGSIGRSGSAAGGGDAGLFLLERLKSPMTASDHPSPEPMLREVRPAGGDLCGHL